MRKYKAKITHEGQRYTLFTFALDLENAKAQIETQAEQKGLTPYTLDAITATGQPCHE